MPDSPLKNETTSDTVSFEFFDRTWSVPTKRHLSHIVKMRDDMRSGVGSVDLMIAETFLSPEQFLDLLDVDPDEEALDAFTTRIADVMGLGNSGNS